MILCKEWLLIAFLFVCGVKVMSQPKKEYICPPCASDCHNQKWETPGYCPICNMELLNAANINDGLNYTHIYPADVCKMVSGNPDIVLLDVRTPGEYQQQSSQLGILKGAINIPIQELGDRLDELEGYKDSEIIVYCSVSMRSPRASKLLSDNGFEKIHNMLGGMTTWNSAPEEEVTCKEELLLK